MYLHQFSDEEIALVRQAHPGLQIVKQGTWQGDIEINAIHDGNNIRDNFQIEIVAPAGYPNIIPFLREIGGRTQKIAQKHGLQDLRTLHHNYNGTACVCVKQEESSRFPKGSNLLTFIASLVVPYLYGLSFFDKYGRWPWPEFSHGGLGLLEFYAENQREPDHRIVKDLVRHLRANVNWKVYNKQLRQLRPDKSCPCGSEKAFQKCHGVAWLGMQRLHTDVRRLNLNPLSLFQAASEEIRSEHRSRLSNVSV